MRTLVALCLTSAAAHRADVTPLQKVTEMLGGMAAKGKAEKHAEEVEFAEFHQFCDSTRAEKTKSIADAAAQIIQLSADIDKANADAEGLAQEISELQGEVATLESEANKATNIRDAEHVDYVAQHADFSESISAVERALMVLKARKADVPQSLIQVRDSHMVPAHAKAMIDSFLEMQSAESSSAPEANAYEFQSESVVLMLEKLNRKFKDQLLALEKEEMNSKANFEVLLQKLTDDIRADKSAIDAKTSAKAGRLEDAATAKADKEVTETNKAEDEKVLTDTNGECAARSDEFEQNQVVRANEIQAVEKAIEILTSAAVKGNAEKYLPAAAASFAMLRSDLQKDPAITHKVSEFLQERAQKLGSRYLSMVAARVQEDPFGKVKKMIKDLIVKLMEEANAEADHHAYCETELATNKQTRDNKASEVEDLSAESDKLTAETAQLADEIQQLSDEIAEIKGNQAEATKIRNEEKKTNAQTIADAKEAQVAVSKATQVLKDFYGSVDGDALIQEPYKGMMAESGGIIGMLEVVLSDFARLEADTDSAEAAQASSYAKFMDESNETVAVKDTTMKHKDNKKNQKEERNRKAKKELQMTQEELDAALEYYDKLKADCIDTDLSYADRKKAREEEIQSLNEALAMLDEQTLA